MILRDPREKRPMECPRCQQTLKSVTFSELEDAEVFLCPGCEGGWYPQAALTCLTQDSDREEIEASALAPTLEADKLDTIDLEAAVDCPECGREMTRFAYPLAPDTMLDRCDDHGMWLDDGELGVMLDQIEASQKLIEESRKGVAEAREEMDMKGIAKGRSINPIGLTLRLLNKIFGASRI